AGSSPPHRAHGYFARRPSAWSLPGYHSYLRADDPAVSPRAASVQWAAALAQIAKCRRGACCGEAARSTAARLLAELSSPSSARSVSTYMCRMDWEKSCADARLAAGIVAKVQGDGKKGAVVAR